MFILLAKISSFYLNVNAQVNSSLKDSEKTGKEVDLTSGSKTWSNPSKPFIITPWNTGNGNY